MVQPAILILHREELGAPNMAVNMTAGAKNSFLLVTSVALPADSYPG